MPRLTCLNLLTGRMTCFPVFRNASISDVQVYSLMDLGRDYNVSANFTLGEFACNDGSDIVLIHPALIPLLEAMRLKFGGPLFINSAYRTHLYNLSIGGAPRSKHLLGMAADIWTPNTYPTKVADYAEDLNIGGVGRYKTFTHVDIYNADRRWSL